MNKLVSIIIPIYNVEKYIKKTILSVINQDYKNIEIILVDDGTPDKSAEIMDEMAEVDKRIICVHKENGGVSSARNAGLEVAKGEYITFIDGDDWVESDYVTYFVRLLEDSECDIAMNKNNFTGHKDLSNEKWYMVDSEKAIEWIYKGEVFVAVWNKFFHKSLLEKNNIVFNEKIWYGEGMLFNIECLQYTDQVVIGEKSVYHQTFNLDSAMRKFNLESNFCGIESLKLQKKIWKKSNKSIEEAWNYHRYCFNRSIIDGLVRSRMLGEHQEVYNNCVLNLRKDIAIPMKMEKNFKKKIMWLGYYTFPYFMALGKRCLSR